MQYHKQNDIISSCCSLNQLQFSYWRQFIGEDENLNQIIQNQMLGGNLAKQKQLEDYTKDHAHHGVNCLLILENFKQYIEKCSDSENIFRYMEQKAICTFLPEYWILKAEYLADIGDFSACFECIEQAQSRNGIGEDDNQRIIDVNKKQQELLVKMVNEMKSFPLKSKRTVEEYNFFTNPNKFVEFDDKNIPHKYQKQLSIYEAKYGGLRKQKEKRFKMKRENLPQSWLAEIYEKEEIQQKKIEEKIHENSVRLSRQVKYHSMHTPLKSRDPQRLTKTMDSVEILRKKRSTNEKSRNNPHSQKYDSDDQFENFEKSNSKLVASVPVGKSFSNLRRRVTFEFQKQ